MAEERKDRQDTDHPVCKSYIRREFVTITAGNTAVDVIAPTEVIEVGDTITRKVEFKNAGLISRYVPFGINVIVVEVHDKDMIHVKRDDFDGCYPAWLRQFNLVSKGGETEKWFCNLYINTRTDLQIENLRRLAAK